MKHSSNIPLRKCIGCGKRLPKSELIRIVRTPKDIIPKSVLVCEGHIEGRGAYLCKNSECLNKARKQKRLERAFSCKIDSKIYDDIERKADGTE